MNSIQIECFLNLANTLNFSETAKQLYISQQAVSKNIAKLEENLQFPLFVRTPHNVQLTSCGEQYLKLVKSFIREESLILESYQQESNTFKLLTLGQPDFEPVRRSHPFIVRGTNLPIHISLAYDTPSLLIERLLKKEVDMVVTLDRFVPNKTGLVIYPVYELEIAILVSKKHPLYHDDAVFNDFAEENFIAGVNGSDFFGTRDLIMRDIESFSLHPRSITICTSADEAIRRTADGEGIILGSVMSNPYYKNTIATIPSGKKCRIVCVWNENNCKSYSEEYASFLAGEFIHAENDPHSILKFHQ